jgi:pyruvate/2-oxoglutarate dehydrogenase complex dihydrolipoamide acyltransferase (E2) component
MMPTPMGSGTLRALSPEQLMVRPMHQTHMTVPQFSVHTDVDMTLTSALREHAEPLFQQQTGARLGFTPFLIKAAAKGLRASPEVNSMMTPTGLWLYDRIAIAVIIQGPKGLLCPSMKDPDRKSVGQIALELNDLTERGRKGQLRPEEFFPSYFSISNGGRLGFNSNVPMVLPPHVAVFGTAAITKEACVVNNRVEIRPVMEVVLGCDHRALDGDHAAKFLNAFKETVETAQYA